MNTSISTSNSENSHLIGAKTENLSNSQIENADSEGSRSLPSLLQALSLCNLFIQRSELRKCKTSYELNLEPVLHSIRNSRKCFKNGPFMKSVLRVGANSCWTGCKEGLNKSHGGCNPLHPNKSKVVRS